MKIAIIREDYVKLLGGYLNALIINYFVVFQPKMIWKLDFKK